MRKVLISCILSLLFLMVAILPVHAAPAVDIEGVSVSHSGWQGSSFYQNVSNGVASDYAYYSTVNVTNWDASSQYRAARQYSRDYMTLCLDQTYDFSSVMNFFSGQTFDFDIQYQNGVTGNEAVYVYVVFSDYTGYSNLSQNWSQNNVPCVTALDALAQTFTLDDPYSVTDYHYFGVKKFIVSQGVTYNFKVPVFFPSSFNGRGVVSMYCVRFGSGRTGNVFTTLWNGELVPTGSTVDLWRQYEFQNEVIGSEDSGGLKGIFEKIKQLPENIANAIKGFFDDLFVKIRNFFLPEDSSFIENFRSRMEQLLNDHLGFVAQAPSFLRSIFDLFSSFDPPDHDHLSDYDLKIPSKSFFIRVGDGNDQESGFDISESDGSGFLDFTLIPDDGDGFHHIDLSFFDNEHADRFFFLYRLLFSVILIFGLVAFGIKKYNQVVSAGGGD